MVTYDAASKIKFHGLTPLQLFAYMLGCQLWAVSTGMDVPDEGSIRFVDAEWVRDLHVVLVNRKIRRKRKKLKKWLKFWQNV